MTHPARVSWWAGPRAQHRCGGHRDELKWPNLQGHAGDHAWLRLPPLPSSVSRL